MELVIVAACILAAFPIYNAIARPIARMLGVVK